MTKNDSKKLVHEDERNGGAIMKIENIEEARILISKRNTLLDVIKKSDTWKSGHFEFVEHVGNSPDKIQITRLPELQEKMIALIREEVEKIDARIEKL